MATADRHAASTTPAVRLAVALGPLTARRIRERERQAAQAGVGFLEVLEERELLHLQAIRRALGEEANWHDAVWMLVRM